VWETGPGGKRGPGHFLRRGNGKGAEARLASLTVGSVGFGVGDCLGGQGRAGGCHAEGPAHVGEHGLDPAQAFLISWVISSISPTSAAARLAVSWSTPAAIKALTTSPAVIGLSSPPR
jgi:hypothetical protein